MKKIKIIIIFLFILATASYAGIYREAPQHNNSEETAGYSGSLYRGASNNTLNDRPDSGDAIGQEAPLGDGLYILIAGCIVLGTIKILKRKRKIVGNKKDCNVINSTTFSIYWGFADSQKQQQCKLFHP